MTEKLIILTFVVFIMAGIPLLIIHYFICRLKAKECPECGEKWCTELVGEWDCEMWECQKCKHYWEVGYED